MEDHSYKLWINARKCNCFLKFFEQNASGTWRWNSVFLNEIASNIEKRAAAPQMCSLRGVVQKI